jgi:hypothetical protein
MRARMSLFLVAASFLLGGCAASLHRVAPEKNCVFDPSLLGKWIHTDKDGERTEYLVEKEEPDGYRISFVPAEKTLKQVYTAHVFRLGDALFYDAVFSNVAQKDETLDAEDLGVYRTHAFGRIWIQPDVIRVGELNEDWLETALDSKKVTLKYEEGDSHAGVNILLTGSPEEIRAFAQKYADDKDAFSMAAVYHRQK